MVPIETDPSWNECFPDARLGLLEAHGLQTLDTHPSLEAARMELETELRARYGHMDRKGLRELPVMRAFETHCKIHGKTYHVLQQLESVACKGRSIPSRICAVTALFMAELKHGLVAAGHDLERLAPPLILAASRGGERYTNLGGAACILPGGDMILLEARGLLSSVLMGPQKDSPIDRRTQDALFTIYAPRGLPAGTLEGQLGDLESFLRLFSPSARIETSVIPVVA